MLSLPWRVGIDAAVDRALFGVGLAVDFNWSEYEAFATGRSAISPSMASSQGSRARGPAKCLSSLCRKGVRKMRKLHSLIWDASNC